MKKIIICLIVCGAAAFFVRTYFSESESKPFNFSQSAAVRLGTEYGGWVIPQSFLQPNSVCYSVGVGEDISFDIELIKRYGCSVYLFDPTPKAVKHVAYVKEAVSVGKPAYINHSQDVYNLSPQQLYALKMYEYGLWSEDKITRFYMPKDPSHVSCSIVNLQKTQDYFDAQCKKVSTLMKEFGHKKIDLLKLDIEGAEYEVLENILDENIHPNVLCIEFHKTRDQITNRVMAKLERAGYKLFYRYNQTDFTFVMQS